MLGFIRYVFVCVRYMQRTTTSQKIKRTEKIIPCLKFPASSAFFAINDSKVVVDYVIFQARAAIDAKPVSLKFPNLDIEQKKK